MNISKIRWYDLIKEAVGRKPAQRLGYSSKRLGESLSNRVWYKVIGLFFVKRG